MILRAGLPLQDLEFCPILPTGIYDSNYLITERVGGYFINLNGERYAPSANDLVSHDVVIRSMIIEISAGHGIGLKKDHIHLVLSHLDPAVIHHHLPGIIEIAIIFVGVLQSNRFLSTNCILLCGDEYLLIIMVKY